MAVDGASGAERESGLLGNGGEAGSRRPEPWLGVRVRRESSSDVVAPRVTMMFVDRSVVFEGARDEMPEGCCATVSRRSEHRIHGMDSLANVKGSLGG